jgi:mono/diheme cytochrome c family protein
MRLSASAPGRSACTRCIVAGAWVVAATCLVAMIAGCEHAPGYPPQPIASPAEVTDFTTLFNQNCAACHGRKGQNGPAIDLGNPEYQALAEDDAINTWVSGGMPGTEMPAFAQSSGGMLSNHQIDALIAGMRKAWSKPNALGGATPPDYADSGSGDTHKGEQAYQARCAGCHAATAQQITSPGYLSLVANQALRSIIIAGRPDIGHPDWRHDGPQGQAATPLSAEEVDNIVAYLASLRSQKQPAVPGASGAQAGR